MEIEEIAECFFEYARKKGNPYEKFPLGTDVEEFGAPYIEISNSGRIAIVAKNRGEECLRKETQLPEVLAKWIYKMFNKT